MPWLTDPSTPIMLAMLCILLILVFWLLRRSADQTHSHQHALAEAHARFTQLQSEQQQLALQENSLTQQLAHQQEQQHELQQRLAQAEHDARQLHRAQATLEAVTKQMAEAQQRLEHTEQQLELARQHTDTLKDNLAQEGQKSRALEVMAEQTEQHCQSLQKQLSEALAKQDSLQQRLTELTQEHTRLRTEYTEREDSHARELANFEQQKASLSEQFKLLANDILDAKAKMLQQTSQGSLSSVLAPFQQTLDQFKKEVHDIHHRETHQQGELRKELETLKTLNQQITTEAHELSTALKGQKKLQGNWGELVLENVLDRSGLRQGQDYQREVSINTETGRQRPDAVVYLPHGKHLIIDAKVSLNAYTRYVNAEDDNERASALKEHVKAITQHIKTLAGREYFQLPGLNSPDMVFMFIPIESAFVEAFKADETLFESALESHVLVATPTTLLTSLNIVRQLWRYEEQNKHTAELADKAEKVFKKLNTFLASFESIKKGLDKANEAYEKAENQLLSGKGNLVKQVGDFKNLAPAIKAELPDYFTDKAALEIDFITTDPSSDLPPD
ncbi:MAG: DNA recombination protein RmuC [Methylococcales bacterium]|nr:DNA recombination protein RmuC [Methylococcales bacterium]